MDFDEEDLNRLYEALVTQIETYNGDPDWKEELVALKDLRGRIALKELQAQIRESLND